MASFWSLLIQPGKTYAKQIENGIQVTHATLDTTKATASNSGLVQVVLRHEGQQLTVANLSMKHAIFQTQLDLLFQGGEEVTFSTSGAEIPVVLTGTSGSDDSDDEADYDEILEGTGAELEESEEEPDLVPAGTKRKANGSGMEPHAKHAKLSNGKKALIALSGQSFMSEDDSDDDSYNPVPDLDDDASALPEEEDMDDTMETMEDSGGDDEEDEDDDDDEESDDEAEAEAAAAIAAEALKKLKNQARSPKAAASPKQKDTPKAPKEAPKTPKDGKMKKEPKTPKSEKKEKSEKSPLQLNNKENIEKTPKQKKVHEGKKDSAQKAHKQTRAGGVLIEDVTAGGGAEAKVGQKVSVYYEGSLKSTNKCFDKCLSGPPLKFRLGAGEVIKGWDVGVAGMKIGGKRKIAVPPHMGYGKKGSAPAIPANAFLNFTVTLLSVNK